MVLENKPSDPAAVDLKTDSYSILSGWHMQHAEKDVAHSQWDGMGLGKISSCYSAWCTM